MASPKTVAWVLLAGTGALLLAGNCGPRTPDASTQLLAGHPWRIVAYTTTDNTARPPSRVDTYAALPAYRRDDTYQFDTDNTLLFNDGSLRAAATDPPSTSGTWQFVSGQQGLFISLSRAVALGTTGSAAPTTYDLRTLTADTLQLAGGPPAQAVVLTLAQ